MIYSKRERDKTVPMIRYNGNACERTRRQVIQGFAVGVFVLAAMLLIAQSNAHSQITLHDVLPPTSAPMAARRTVDGAPPLPSGIAKAQRPQAQPMLGGDSPSGSECELDKRELLLGNGRGDLPTVGSQEFPSPDHTKLHFDSVMRILRDPLRIQCWRKQKASIASKRSRSSASKFFFDLGSRAMDQTNGFLATYPQASQFVLVCYEANPKFNTVYQTFASDRSNVRLEHHNEAVGVQEGTLVLSDQDVGSSIVRDSGVKQRSRAPGDVEVAVIDFSSTFSERVATVAVESGSFVVMKMDIEKMEFSVLHRMLLSGSILLVDELLLECHYNTNLPREKRDPSKHLGLDDCRALVAALNAAFGDDTSIFEAVLWNSVKTARSSGFSARHGGFKPS